MNKSRMMYVIEWTDKNGVLHRSVPIDKPSPEWEKKWIKVAFDAMCKPVLSRQLIYIVDDE
jgi:hypothetical protein